MRPMEATPAAAMTAPGSILLKNVRRLIALICSTLPSKRVDVLWLIAVKKFRRASVAVGVVLRISSKSNYSNDFGSQRERSRCKTSGNKR